MKNNDAIHSEQITFYTHKDTALTIKQRKKKKKTKENAGRKWYGCISGVGKFYTSECSSGHKISPYMVDLCIKIKESTDINFVP